MNLARLSIQRPTFIGSIIIAMIIMGALCMSRMDVEMFPDVTMPFVLVTVQYPGAGPQEIETLVAKPIEEQLSSISGMKNIYSTSQDGIALVWAEFYLEVDPKFAEQEVKNKVAQVRNRLPDAVKEPVIRRFDPADQPIVMISLCGDCTSKELYHLADLTIKPMFEQLSNVSSVEIIGGSKREIHVALDLNKLRTYETSVSHVAAQVGASTQNIPVGKVSHRTMEMAFRSMGEFLGVSQLKHVVVNFFGSDVPVTIQQLGTVFDTTEDEKTKAYVNGEKTLILNVFKQSKTNTVEVSDAVLKRIKKFNKDFKGTPGNPQLTMVRDSARGIRMNIADVRNTILEGILLAIIVVYFFLGNIRSTLITTIALPNSLIGAFVFMYIFGFSVNVLTLMALSLAVGLLIDDAVVVRENIFRHMERGEDPMTAAQKGTDEVTLAVVATTLTVIAVFLPVGFLQGIVGQFFKQFGLTVVFAMAISLFDAMTTAPMLSAYLITKIEKDAPMSKLRYTLRAPVRSFQRFQAWIERVYERVMRITLRHKIKVLAGAFVVFAGSLALTYSIPTTFMPPNEFGEFTVTLEAKPGTSLEQMERYTREVEQLVRNEKDIELVLSTIGTVNGESNVSSLFVKMVPAKQRKRLTSDMKEYVRKRLAPYRNELIVQVNDMSMAGEEQPFLLILIGDDLDTLAKISEHVIQKLKTIPDLTDFNTNYKTGKPEFQFKMDREKMRELGIQPVMAGMELRGMVEGLTPAKFREHGDEYDIRVRLQDNQRDVRNFFNELYVPNMNDQLVKVKHFATRVQTTGPTKIERRNRARYIQISANLTKHGAVGRATSAAKKILEKEKFPRDVTYTFIGDSEDMNDLFKNMLIAALLSIIFIYLVLASLYESIIIPFTIMLALPLAIVGGLAGLYVTGNAINMFTMIGFIMLLGLVTKNSILLVDYAQRLLRTGMSHNDAVITAGLTRLRPILMTTLALIAGMLPIALALTEVGKFRKSMGIVIIGGLLSSTILTLVVIPAVFEYMDNFRRWLRRVLRRPEQREVDKTVPTTIVE